MPQNGGIRVRPPISQVPVDGRQLLQERRHPGAGFRDILTVPWASLGEGFGDLRGVSADIPVHRRRETQRSKIYRDPQVHHQVEMPKLHRGYVERPMGPKRR
jgi:hypothetical protein